MTINYNKLLKETQMNKIIQKWEHFEYILSNIINLQNGQYEGGTTEKYRFQGDLRVIQSYKKYDSVFFSTTIYIFHLRTSINCIISEVFSMFYLHCTTFDAWDRKGTAIMEWPYT